MFQNQAGDLGIDQYYMNFIVSLAKIPGGLFAAVFLKRFSRRPVFLASALLVITGHTAMGLTNMGVLPPEFAMASIAMTQFAYTAGYVSVAGLLLGVLLPSSSRSTFTGLVAAVEGLSSLSESFISPHIVDAIGDSGLFFVFAGVVTACFVFMLFLMPETKGKTLEEIENIFLSPRKKGCAVRRSPREDIDTARRATRRQWTTVRGATRRRISRSSTLKASEGLREPYLRMMSDPVKAASNGKDETTVPNAHVDRAMIGGSVYKY